MNISFLKKKDDWDKYLVYPVITPEFIAFSPEDFFTLDGTYLSQEACDIVNLLSAVKSGAVFDFRFYDLHQDIIRNPSRFSESISVICDLFKDEADIDIDLIKKTASNIYELGDNDIAREKKLWFLYDLISNAMSREGDIDDIYPVECSSRLFLRSGDKEHDATFARLSRVMMALADEVTSSRDITWSHNRDIKQTCKMAYANRLTAADAGLSFPFSVNSTEWISKDERDRAFFESAKEIVRERWKQGIGAGDPPYDFDKKIDYDKL